MECLTSISSLIQRVKSEIAFLAECYQLYNGTKCLYECTISGVTLELKDELQKCPDLLLVTWVTDSEPAKAHIWILEANLHKGNSALTYHIESCGAIIEEKRPIY